jgi:hypothetical protein
VNGEELIVNHGIVIGFNHDVEGRREHRESAGERAVYRPTIGAFSPALL